MNRLRSLGTRMYSPLNGMTLAQTTRETSTSHWMSSIRRVLCGFGLGEQQACSRPMKH